MSSARNMKKQKQSFAKKDFMDANIRLMCSRITPLLIAGSSWLTLMV